MDQNHRQAGSSVNRDIHRLEEWQHDPYHARVKWIEPSFCPECGAVYHKGHWQWLTVPANSEAVFCPACQRIKDHCPAAFLTLKGDFFGQHRDEILQRVHRVEEAERQRHPLKRIMSEDESGNACVIHFTDPHLARTAGQAIHAAYQGQLDIDYQKDEYLLRVTWQR